MRVRRIGLLVGMAGVLLLALTAPASADQPQCFGKDATIVGTNKPETIYGSPGDDVIVAKGGGDMVFGEGGDDRICGNGGDDFLIGGSDDDKLSLGAGQGGQLGVGDNGCFFFGCDGQEGFDNAVSSLQEDGEGGDGNDLVIGSYQSGDLLFGEGGDDEIHARGKGDLVLGGFDDDEIHLGPANRTQQLGFGDNACVIVPEFGCDGQEGNDAMFGGYKAFDVMFGEGGNDELHGSGKADFLEGDLGNDDMFGGPKDDFLQAADGEADLVDGKDGKNTCDTDPQDTVRNCYYAAANRAQINGEDASNVRQDAKQRIEDRVNEIENGLKQAAGDAERLDTTASKPDPGRHS